MSTILSWRILWGIWKLQTTTLSRAFTSLMCCSMTLLYNLYDAENRVFTCEQQTSVYYEALHNVNKKMDANLILNRSKVVTYGRNSLSYPWHEHMLSGTWKCKDLSWDSEITIQVQQWSQAHRCYESVLYSHSRLCTQRYCQLLLRVCCLSNLCFFCQKYLHLVLSTCRIIFSIFQRGDFSTEQQFQNIPDKVGTWNAHFMQTKSSQLALDCSLLLLDQVSYILWGRDMTMVMRLFALEGL